MWGGWGGVGGFVVNDGHHWGVLRSGGRDGNQRGIEKKPKKVPDPKSTIVHCVPSWTQTTGEKGKLKRGPYRKSAGKGAIRMGKEAFYAKTKNEDTRDLCYNAKKRTSEQGKGETRTLNQGLVLLPGGRAKEQERGRKNKKRRKI